MVVKPFNLKGFFNTTLSVLVPVLSRGSNGFPGGHTDLSRSLPSLKQDSFEGVMVIEVPTASLRPEIVKQEAPKDVQRLFVVGVSACVITMKV
jgi:hypothetical protein